MKIETLKFKSDSNIYDVNNYCESGIFKVEKEGDKLTDLPVILADKEAGFVLFLNDFLKIKPILQKFIDYQKEEVQELQFQPIVNAPKEENKLSEDFALKLLSIALNKEKFKDINI